MWLVGSHRVSRHLSRPSGSNAHGAGPGWLISAEQTEQTEQMELASGVLHGDGMGKARSYVGAGLGGCIRSTASVDVAVLLFRVNRKSMVLNQG